MTRQAGFAFCAMLKRSLPEELKKREGGFLKLPQSKSKLLLNGR